MGRFQESAEDMAKESEIRLLVNCTDINMTNVRAIMHTKGTQHKENWEQSKEGHRQSFLMNINGTEIRKWTELA